MNKKRLIITSVISIILVVILMLGSTYSLFSFSEDKQNLETNVYTTGNLNITYTVSDDTIKLEKSIPVTEQESLSIKPYRITVTNTGNVPYMFDLKLNSTTASNEIDNQYIMTQIGKMEPKTLESCVDNVLKEDIIVPAGESVDVDVRVYISKDIKNSEIGKSFFAKLEVGGVAIYDENEEIDTDIFIATYYGEVTISFDANGGEVSQNKKTVISTLPYGELPTPTRTDVVVYETNGGSDVNFVSSLGEKAEKSYLNKLPKSKANLLNNNPNVITIDYEFGGWYLDQSFTKLVTSETIVESSTNLTLYAKWIGNNVITLPSTNRTNYQFDGWYSDTNYQNKLGDPGDTYELLGSITFYGKWTRTHFTLTYNNNGGIGCGSEHILLTATTYGELCTPSRAGYEFLGWYTASSGGTKITSTTTLPEKENHTIYAHWEAKLYNIKFHNNLNFLSGANSVIVTLSGRNYYKKYDDPALVGYLYNGTYTGPVLVGTTANSVAYYTDHDSATTFTSGGTFEQDGVTYYYASDQGYWMAGNITDTSGLANRVKYSNMTVAEAARQILLDQDVTVEQEMYYEIAENLTANTYSKTGYTFNGWSTTPTGSKEYNDNQSLNSSTEYDNDILNLYANWTPNNYTLLAHPMGGTIPATSGWAAVSGHDTFTKGVVLGNTFGTLPTPTRTGYNFNGWTNVATVGTFSLTGGTSNYVWYNALYQIYPGTTYKITMDSATLTAGTATKFATLIYDFTTSTTVTTGPQISFGSGISYTITCPTTAIASNDIRIIIYSGINGSTSGNNTTFTNVKISTNNTTTASTQTTSTPYSLAANQTIFATWTAKTYTVTLNNQSATSAGSTSVTATYGSAMPAITKPSRSYTVTYYVNGGNALSSDADTAIYEFEGYYTATSGGGTQYYTKTGVSARNWDLTSATTLYAKWTSKSVTLRTPSKTGYSFNGWYTAASGGTKIGDGGETYTPTSNIKIYAQWTIKNYPVTIGRNNTGYGTVSTGSVSVPYNTTYTVSGATLTFSNGTKVTASVTNAEGYITSFSSWSSTSGTITAATTITANFSRSEAFYSISSPANGANTLAAAINLASSGATIKLLKDTDDRNDATFNKNLTFDTNGKKLIRGTTAITINSGYSVLINGSGTISSTPSSSKKTIYNSGNLTISGPTISGTGAGATVYIKSSGTTKITSGTITSSLPTYNGSGYSAVYIDAATTGAVTISGGTIKTDSTNTGGAINQLSTSAVLTISGVTINAYKQTLLTAEGSTTKITSGTFTSSTVQAIRNHGKLTISGGTFSATDSNTIQNGTSDDPVGLIFISGGTFKNTGSGTAVIKNFSNDAWDEATCTENDSIHIGGTATVSNTGSGYGVHNESTTGLGIHTPKAYTGYIYSKNNTTIRAKSGKIQINGGTIYSPSANYSGGGGTVNFSGNSKRVKGSP